jgi:molybdopterin converting factor small subunit
MSVTVRIPTILRSFTGGASEVSVDPQPTSLSGVLIALEAQAPGISGRILDDEGHLRRFVNIFVDDEDVRYLNGLETVIPERTVISVIPAVAGG